MRRIWCSVKTLKRAHSTQGGDHSYLASPAYWQQRYREQGRQQPFEWLLPPRQLLPYFLPVLSEHAAPHCLDLGCGTSQLSLELLRYASSPLRITALDYSHDALDVTRQSCLKQQPQAGLSLVQADARRLPFPDNSFDVIMDKGTSDSICKLQKPQDRTQWLEGIFQECFRTLKRHGVLLQVTDEDPELRLHLLETYSGLVPNKLSISYKIIEAENSVEYFIYYISVKQ